MLYTRRDAGKIAIAALPALKAFGAPRINSKVGGVQIGAITYSYGQMNIDDIIKNTAEIGIGVLELMSNHAESAVGAPTPAGGGFGGGMARGAGQAQGRGAGAPGAPGGQARGAGAPGAPGGQARGAGAAPGGGRMPTARPPMTDEQIANARNSPRAKEMLAWRMGLDLNKYKDLRKRFDNVGIDLQILCYNMNEATTDEEIDYAFRMAKALGCKSLSSSTQVTVAKRVAPFAEKHKMIIGFHGHDNNVDPNEFGSLESYAKGLSYGKYNGINLDVGHFTAAGYDALAYLKENHKRISNLHIKDRKKDHGPNVPWGEGDTPLKEIFALIRKEKYQFPCDIELEYRVPEGSTRVAEMKKCLEYCKQNLG